MDNSIILEILIILFLILLNGLFAMSETAIVSARKPRLQQQANTGDKNALLALRLVEDPEDFLSTVQIGITLIGILAGVYGGATLAEDLADAFVVIGLPAGYSETVSVVLVVVIITYLSLVIGELVPKNLALRNSERLATAVAPFMHRLSRIVYPFVWLLSISTQFVTRLLRVKATEEAAVTDEEIEIMLEQGAKIGVFEPEEPEIVRRLFRLSDRTVRSLMTPRHEIVWLDRADTLDETYQKIINKRFSRFPVADGDLDQVVGFIEVKDLVDRNLSELEFDPFKRLYPPVYVPETMSALDLLDRFKKEHGHMALVFDEYGGLEGLITSTDLVEAIVGNIDLPSAPSIIQRKDNSWLVDGSMPFVELLDFFEKEELEGVSEGHYQSVGGFMLSTLKEVPTEGESINWEGFRFEVIDMDGFRVDKVLVSIIASGETGNP